MFWRRTDPGDPDGGKPERAVDDQHALPVNLYWKPDENLEAEETTLVRPFPVRDSSAQSPNGRILPQVAVSTSAVTLIAAFNSRRKQIKITNTTGTQVVWLGSDGSLTATNGDFLGATLGSTFTTDARNAIYGLSATAAQTVSVYETEYVS